MSQVSPPNHLLRVLGFTFAFAAVIGGVIGQGIMRTPGIVAQATSNPALILVLWCFGGMLAFIAAFAFVELGAALPRAGGPYVFVTSGLGPTAGSAIGWADWLNGISVIAYVAVVFSEYLQRLGIGVFAPLGALAAGTVAVVTLLNLVGTRTSGGTQMIGSALKGAGLLALIIALLLYRGEPVGDSAGPPTALTFAGFAIAMRAIFSTYSGWNSSVYFSEEITAPSKNIARATFGGIALVSALYVGVNFALLQVLTPSAMASSNLPVADAVSAVLGETSGLVVTVFALISVAAVANLYQMFTSRIAFAMARDGVLPRFLTRIARNGAPYTAVGATALAAALLASTGSYELLLALSAPSSILIDISVNLAAIRHRRKEPALHRPFRMPLFPIPALLAIALNAALLTAVFVEDPLMSSLGLCFLAIIATGYWLRRSTQVEEQA